ncbi:unknown protein [Seminavis robusta]|uniref:BTB domain-containing protein n=1 Tax=Seminavis robusta TaxID=568900 RepID=A0A9N8DJ34_9STRA|nr:unknown protein [Seminavis robusta]|eukprot:Sro88_g046340.1 n/a (269) ;mRNA; f:18111-18917
MSTPLDNSKPLSGTDLVLETMVNRVCSSDEKTVEIVVGGKSFFETKGKLCSWSGFFDAAIQHGWKEARSMQFMLPDDDPAEWEFMMSLLAEPALCHGLRGDNIHIALAWFDYFDISRGLEQCDKFLSTNGEFHVLSRHLTQKRFRRSLTCLEFGLRYNLLECKERGFGFLRGFICGTSFGFEMSLADIRELVLLLKNYKDCCVAVWPFIEKHLLKDVSRSPRTLLGNDLLPALMLTRLQLNDARQKCGSDYGKESDSEEEQVFSMQIL